MNQTEILESVVADQLNADAESSQFTIGDTLNVHVRIIEGDKERIQVYQGVLIADRGRGVNRMITVRRIVANEGVERIFPLHSPRIAKLEVVRRGDARRSKLYYLRQRVGKSRRLRDQRRGLKHQSECAAGGRYGALETALAAAYAASSSSPRSTFSIAAMTSWQIGNTRSSRVRRNRYLTFGSVLASAMRPPVAAILLSASTRQPRHAESICCTFWMSST